MGYDDVSQGHRCVADLDAENLELSGDPVSSFGHLGIWLARALTRTSQTR